MADDALKKFYSTMDKLFHSSKTKSNPTVSPSAPKSKGPKRPFSVVEPNSAQAPPCRPWDRRDLMRRIATFKSMRWFAKPKAVGAVNCARRGWVNVDMDIIACESCGARLQFSTPSTWNQQQVEKAALVFSLKLDSGHKLLCPWIDNACDESLALFQPRPTEVLVEQYKERSSALSKLSALPVMSDLAIKSIKNPQLEHFLKQSIAVECGAGLPDSQTEYFGSDIEAVSGDLYYQAHRLLSLCGWEPRLLPYAVDCDEEPKLSGSNTSLTGLSPVASGEQNNKLCVYVSGSGESIEENNVPTASSGYYQPSSTVLDCKLCGASIGLWAFATVPRPLELVRVGGYAEIGEGNEHSTTGNHANSGRSDISAAGRGSRETTLNLTIAGGPPPTKQNFRATISLPIIGRNVRARFSSLSSQVSSSSEEGHTSQNAIMEGLIEKKLTEEINSGKGLQDNVAISNGTGFTSDVPATAVDVNTNCQQMPTDNGVSTEDASTSEQMDNGVGDITESGLQKDVSTDNIDKDLRSHCLAKKIDFHPIRQHRHFCPWVASIDTTAPGWQQTLSALHQKKVFSLPESEASPSSSSSIMVDDPIESIRKLFESPPAKRAKPALRQ